MEPKTIAMAMTFRISASPTRDCNDNTIRDLCEIGEDPSLDCDGSLRLDECEFPVDCNENERPDACDVADGTSRDCNQNGVPDECDIEGPDSDDRNGDGVPDECLSACCGCGCEERTGVDCNVRDGDIAAAGSTCDDDLSCTAFPTFLNDSCQFAEELASGPVIEVQTDTRCATNDGPGMVPCVSEEPFGADLWYTWVAPCDGQATFTQCFDNSYDGIIAVYEGAHGECICPASHNALLGCGDDTCGLPGGTGFVTTNVTGGTCYTIRVGGWSGATGISTTQRDDADRMPSPPVPATARAGRKRQESIHFNGCDRR